MYVEILIGKVSGSRAYATSCHQWAAPRQQAADCANLLRFIDHLQAGIQNAGTATRPTQPSFPTSQQLVVSAEMKIAGIVERLYCLTPWRFEKSQPGLINRHSNTSFRRCGPPPYLKSEHAGIHDQVDHGYCLLIEKFEWWQIQLRIEVSTRPVSSSITKVCSRWNSEKWENDQNEPFRNKSRCGRQPNASVACPDQDGRWSLWDCWSAKYIIVLLSILHGNDNAVYDTSNDTAMKMLQAYVMKMIY